jgi:hypothetical protein
MVHPFPTKINITLNPLGAAFPNFSDIFCSYIKAELKENQRK